MNVRLRQLLSDLADSFWLLPAVLVALAILAALGLVRVDRMGWVPKVLINSPLLYSGGGTGARTLLGAVASSTIGVAGTVFSITIAALSLAAGQMGPRLLSNFTRDRGNQASLGIFLGTFSYALMVLRVVRSETEGEFVPYLSIDIAIVLAFVCVGTLVYFVHHMASRINVDTVINLVARDVADAIDRLTSVEATRQVSLADQALLYPQDTAWTPWQVAVADRRQGYLVRIDEAGLAAWASAHDVVVRLLLRPGDYLFPGSTLAEATADPPGLAVALTEATVVDTVRDSAADLEFPIRQLVEVAVRALSPGINDPHTAISVLDRLGGALCQLACRALGTGLIAHDGQTRLLIPSITYDGLTDAIFHMIRQNGAGSPAVMIHLIEVLGLVGEVEQDPGRRATLRRHADLALSEGEAKMTNPADIADLRRRYGALATNWREADRRRERREELLPQPD
jgi:uncharacterized membrane protein